MTETLFSYLPVEKIRDAFAKSPGDEIESEKLSSPESSAALVANTFGLFLERPGDLPVIPGTEDLGWPATYVGIEFCARFPWSGGRHPWLDVFVETSSHIIGVESKRYEPFRNKQSGTFSAAYRRPVWGDKMGPFEKMRDLLIIEETTGEDEFFWLDAAQLVKHAFGLRTEGNRRGMSAALVYLYAEPKAWPDGRSIRTWEIEGHANEVRFFAWVVDGAEVEFRTCTYLDLLAALSSSPLSDVREHAVKVGKAFQIR